MRGTGTESLVVVMKLLSWRWSEGATSGGLVRIQLGAPGGDADEGTTICPLQAGTAGCQVCSPDGSGMSREVHVPLCDQQRLARSAGDSPAGARARRSVAWMAGRRETGALKPIDDTTRGVVASHRAVTRVNAQVAPKVNGPGGRAPNCRAKAARGVAHWLRRHLAPAGW